MTRPSFRLSTLLLTSIFAVLFLLQASCKARNSAANSLADTELDADQRNMNVRVRLSVFDPANKTNVDAYVKAFKLLQSTPEGKKVWDSLASIHENYCPHGNWFFLPWHRVYLAHFERIIAAASGKPDFALPYWDWDGEGRNRIPDIALNPDGLLWPNRSPAAASSAGRMRDENVGKRAMEQIMATKDFFAFGSGRSAEPRVGRGSQGLLEAMPHNSTHVWIDGDMATFLSPKDPVFWMHHANVDRIWSVWMKAQKDAGREILPPKNLVSEAKRDLWLDYQFKKGFIEPANGRDFLHPTAVTKIHRVRDTFESIPMFGYTYPGLTSTPTVNAAREIPDATGAPATSPQYSIQMPLKLKQVAVFDRLKAFVFVIDLGMSTGNDSSGVSVNGLQLLKRASDAFTAAAGNSANLPSAILYVDDVPVPADMKATSLQFYLNTTPQTIPSMDPKNFLGTFSFFGLDHVHENHAAPTATGLILDLGLALQKNILAANSANNLFVNTFVKYTDPNGNDVTDQRQLPWDLKPKLREMKWRLEYSEP